MDTPDRLGYDIQWALAPDVLDVIEELEVSIPGIKGRINARKQQRELRLQPAPEANGNLPEPGPIQGGGSGETSG